MNITMNLVFVRYDLISDPCCSELLCDADAAHSAALQKSVEVKRGHRLTQ